MDMVKFMINVMVMVKFMINVMVMVKVMVIDIFVVLALNSYKIFTHTHIIVYSWMI